MTDLTDDQVLALLDRIANIQSDIEDFDGDRRGHYYALQDAEDALAKAAPDLARALLQARADAAAAQALVQTLTGALREARDAAHSMAHDQYDCVWSEQDFREYTPLADAAIEAAALAALPAKEGE